MSPHSRNRWQAVTRTTLVLFGLAFCISHGAFAQNRASASVQATAFVVPAGPTSNVLQQTADVARGAAAEGRGQRTSPPVFGRYATLTARRELKNPDQVEIRVEYAAN